MERQHILRLISYLKSVESPHEGASPIAQLQKDFKLFYSQYDTPFRQINHVDQHIHV